MIKPTLQDDNFLDEAKSRRAKLPSLDIWWLGQSGFLVRWSDIYIILDPYLSDSLTQKYANTDKPHVRMTERIVDPARLDFIDIITSSHNHTDHLDAQTLKPILQASPNAQLIIPEANRQFVSERLAIDNDRPIGMDDGTSIGLSGVGITAIAAAHNQIERDESGRCKFLG